jgi:hypothetical protein
MAKNNFVTVISENEKKLINKERILVEEQIRDIEKNLLNSKEKFIEFEKESVLKLMKINTLCEEEFCKLKFTVNPFLSISQTKYLSYDLYKNNFNFDSITIKQKGPFYWVNQPKYLPLNKLIITCTPLDYEKALFIKISKIKGCFYYKDILNELAQGELPEESLSNSDIIIVNEIKRLLHLQFIIPFFNN